MTVMSGTGRNSRDLRNGTAALVALAALGWALILWSAANMSSPLVALMMPMQAGWSLAETLAVWLMWAVMMGAMMLPSAIPTIGVVRRVARKRDPEGPASHRWFVAAYLVMWVLFSVAAASLQWGFQRADVLSPMLVLRDNWVSGGILVAAGLFQLTPRKAACLNRCRSPLGFAMTEWRPGRAGAFRMGILHGQDCIFCCWALMLVLFVGGVMSVTAIAVLSGVVALEKLAPHGGTIARAAGGLLIIWGLWLILVVRLGY